MAAKSMLPYLFKKSNEARAVIDYYESRINGNELVAIFQREVEAGRRERRNHTVKIDVPYTYAEGDSMMRERRRQRIRDRILVDRAKVTRQDYESIRDSHFKFGVPLARLVDMYPGYGRETIRRILGRGRARVLIVGEGLKETRPTGNSGG